MNIQLFEFSKKINSTKQPSGGRTVNVKLKEGCSIVHPVFRCLFDATNDNYIKWGSNYYYIDDSIINSNDEIEYHCTRDAMATFKNDIGGKVQFITRSSNYYDSSVIDMKYPTLCDATSQRIVVHDLDNSITTTNGTYVVGVASPNGDNGVSYYIFSSSGLQSFMGYLFGGAWLDSGNEDITLAIQKELINPFQYVVSCMWYPLNLSGYYDSIKFGYWNTGMSGNKLRNDQRVVELLGSARIPNHPQYPDRGLYVNSAPFTELTFNCWCFGSIPIDSSLFVQEKSIGFRVLVDTFSGLADLVITDHNGAMITRQSAQFGVPIQLSQVNQNMLSSGLAILSTTGSAITNAMTGNAVGLTTGIASGVASAVQLAMPQLRTTGTNGSRISFSEPPQITCKFYRQSLTDDATMGRPLMKPYNPRQLGGYMECSNVDLDTTATPAEKEQIISMMERGFFYE